MEARCEVHGIVDAHRTPEGKLVCRVCLDEWARVNIPNILSRLGQYDEPPQPVRTRR